MIVECIDRLPSLKSLLPGLPVRTRTTPLPAAACDGLMLSDEMTQEASGSPEDLVLVNALKEGQLALQAQSTIQALAAGSATAEQIERLLLALAELRALEIQLSHSTWTLLQIALELARQQGLISADRAGAVSGVGNPSAGLSGGSPVPGGIRSAPAHGGGSPSEVWLAPDSPVVLPVQLPEDSSETASSSESSAVLQGAELLEVLDDVAQTDKENCAATSIIKGMMLTFREDPRGPMQIEPLPGGGYRVTMRDGYQTTLTGEQVDQASVATGYEGDNPEEVERANVMMAAAARRYAEVNGISYEEALTRLNDRNHPPDVGFCFGVKLTELPDPNDLSAFEGKSAVIVSNSTHAAVVADTDEGLKQDNYGQTTPYAGRIWAGGSEVGTPTHAYQIEDVSGERQSPPASRISASAFRAIGRSVLPRRGGSSSSPSRPTASTPSGRQEKKAPSRGRGE